MNNEALRKEECQQNLEAYNVEKPEASEVIVKFNDVSYIRKGNTLCRENGEYRVGLHFQEQHNSVIKEFEKVLKNEYINKKRDIQLEE